MICHKFNMPRRRSYGRRRSRSYTRRPKRRRSTRKHSVHFKASGKYKAKTARGRRRINRAAKIACPVVYKCIQKITDHNIVWSLKNCEGLISSTVDDFADSTAATVEQGPFSLGTGESIDPCGYLSAGNIYKNPAAHPHSGLMLNQMNPANEQYYNEIPLDYHLFPIIAQTNPGADANENGQNCRDSTKALINYFDNRHSLRIVWPAVQDADDGVYMMTKDQRLVMHEVVYWVPDLGTVRTHKLISDVGDAGNVAATQALLRTRRKWQLQMYNAKFCTHPVVDSTISDVVDIVTGPPVNAFDTFNEPLAPAVTVIGNNNILPKQRDTKQFLAAGVLDRRKDARVVWSRKRSYRRPAYSMAVAGNATMIPKTYTVPSFAVTDPTTAHTVVMNDVNGVVGGTAYVSLPVQVTKIRCGKKFNIDKQLEWQQGIPDADIEDSINDVCPRGVYCYTKYWFYYPGMIDTNTEDRDLAPKVFANFTGAVDKMMVLKWQNI